MFQVHIDASLNMLRLDHRNAAKTLFLRPLCYILVYNFITRPPFKNLNGNILTECQIFERRSGLKVISQNVAGGSQKQ